MSGPHSDLGPSSSKFPNDLAPAIVTGRPASVTASKSWFKSKVTKAAKVFSSSKLSKSATTSTSTLAANSDDVGPSQHKVSSEIRLQEEPSQSAEGEPIAEESAENLISRPIVELWDEAYDELAKKDKNLVSDYETQLSKSLVGAVASSARVFSGLGKIQRCQQMKALLAKKIKEIDEGEWKLKFQDHELAVKDLVEPVVGVIDWAKDFVSTALEPSPYGSIAWAGVCVLLPVSATFSASPPIIPYLVDLLNLLARFKSV
jgi:hypothetical protein